LKLRITTIALFTLFAVLLASPAHAQITITGPNNGFCTSQPGDPSTPDQGATFLYPIFGAGELGDPSCTHELVADVQIFANQGTGFDIVGAGNLQGLLIRIPTGFGQGFTAHVWVTHNGVGTEVMSCTAGSNVQGDPVPDCVNSTSVAPVADKDKVEIFITGSRGDTYANMKWYLGKN